MGEVSRGGGETIWRGIWRRGWARRWWVVVVGAGTWLFFAALWGPEGLPTLRRMERDRDALRGVIRELHDLQRPREHEVWLLTPSNENTPLETRAARDQEIERRARKDQNMIRSGETVFVFPRRVPGNGPKPKGPSGSKPAEPVSR